MTRAHLIAAAALVALAAVARAGEDAKPATPADRANVQRETKAALVETKLPDSELGPLFTEIEGFMRDYTRWVLEVGPAEAKDEDAEDVVRRELEPMFEARAIALGGQSSIIKLAASRIEAIRMHAERIADDQAKVKAEIADANLNDAEVDGSVLLAAIGFAHASYQESAFPGRANDTRPAAVDVATTGLLPILQKAEMPEKNAERLCAAVGDWMNALWLLDDEAKLTSD